MDLKGKVAVITGGAQGIGKAISITLLNAGMKVLICDINESSAKAVLEEISDDYKPNAIYHKCDVSSFNEFKAAFEKAKSTYGRIDVVINNAGVLNEKQWKKVVEVNFIGVIHGIHLAFEFMGVNNGGSGGFVINTSSVAGLHPSHLVPVYAGTKHGVVGLTRSYGHPFHFEKTGVTVNAVLPGSIDTQMFHTFPKFSVDEERGKEFISPMKLISPFEVAEGVMKLLRDGKNGALLSVNDEGIYYEK